MSNVIKQRQLSNGDKLTPKTDFMYTRASTAARQQVINIDGTIKLDDFLISSSTKGQSFSVGKGQVIDIEVHSSKGVTLELFDKNTGENLNSLKIDEVLYYIYSKKVATFLGKPFQADGDNDRYIILNYWNGSLYEPRIFNIDKWEFKGEWEGGWSHIAHDFVFDGVDRVYFKEDSGNNLQSTNIYTNSNEPPVDSAGNYIPIDRVYGLSNDFLFLKNNTDKQIGRYTISTKEKISWGAPGVESLNAINFGRWLLMSNDGNGVWIRNDAGSETYFLNDSLLAANVIGSGEAGLIPVLITDYVETDSDITIDWVLIREAQFASGNFATKAVQTTINKSSGNIVSTKIGDTFGLTYTSIDTAINSFSNSCNSYGIGKFYNYGLQKQWDTNHETM